MDLQKTIDTLNAIIADNGAEACPNAIARLARIMRDEYAAVLNPRAAMIPPTPVAETQPTQPS